jgi:hypothetical protein
MSRDRLKDRKSAAQHQGEACQSDEEAAIREYNVNEAAVISHRFPKYKQRSGLRSAI